MQFGVNTWVRTAPLTTAALQNLAPHIKSLGFGWIEIPLESLADLDHKTGVYIIAMVGHVAICGVCESPAFA